MASGEALSSDLLEREHGDTEINILFHDDLARVIATRTVRDKKILEVSWSVFLTGAAELFPEAYEAMKKGESMGEAFTSRDIKFRRSKPVSYLYDLPPAFQRWFGETRNATVIDLTALVGPDEKPFARILETYRPGSIKRWKPLPVEPPYEMRRQIDILGNFLDTTQLPN